MSYRITEIWAFTAIDDLDEEGVVAFPTAEGWAPMIAADQNRLTELTPMAQRYSDENNRRVRLVKFTGIEEIKILLPKRSN